MHADWWDRPTSLQFLGVIPLDKLTELWKMTIEIVDFPIKHGDFLIVM